MNTFDKLASILSRRKNSASHEQIGITIEHARELIRSYEDLLAQRNAGEFDLFDHLNAPSRLNPLASAAAVHMRKEA